MSENSQKIIELPAYKKLDTLFTLFINSVRQYSSSVAYIYKDGAVEQHSSYSKLFEDVLLLAKAIKSHGVEESDKVMVLSDNRYEWIVSDLALISLGAVNVPRGSDTPSQELEFIITHSKARFLIVENVDLLNQHSDLISSCKELQAVFVMRGEAKNTPFSNVFSYSELLIDRSYTKEDIEKFLERGEELMPDNLLTIIYTSGTTGMPKGVQLSHDNIMHNVQVVPDIIRLSPDDNWLSILPSWHIFERTAEYVALARGTTLVYSSVKTFSQDLEKYKPTLVATVPRVWESLYSRVQSTVKRQGAVAQNLFNVMLWSSAAYRRNKRKALNRMPVYERGKSFQRLLISSVAFTKMALLFPLYKLANKKLSLVRHRFGGRLRLAISGGGTLATYLEEWIDAVGIRIVNAYGMTECSPAIAGRGLACRTYGTVGSPVPGTDLRIVSEQGTVLGPGQEGAIEVRGDQVTKGYYNDQVENDKSFTKDGFLKTGDLGKMTVNGELVVTGRAKEIIVLSSGENIDPTRIENAITMFPFIQDAILVGQDKKGLGALLVPNREELKEYVAAKMSDLRKEKDELLTDVKVLNQIKNEFNHILRPKQGFKPHEKLQGILFLDNEFKLGEELTNTLKKKRHVIEQKYNCLINDLLT